MIDMPVVTSAEMSKLLFKCTLGGDLSRYYELDDRAIYRLACTSQTLHKLVVDYINSAVHYRYNQGLDRIAAKLINPCHKEFIRLMHNDVEHNSLQGIRVDFIKRSVQLCIRLNQFEEDEIQALRFDPKQDNAEARVHIHPLSRLKPIAAWDNLIVKETMTWHELDVLVRSQPLKEWGRLAMRLLAAGKIEQANDMMQSHESEYKSDFLLGLRNFAKFTLLNARYLNANEKRLVVADLFDPLFVEWLQRDGGYREIETVEQLACGDFKENIRTYFALKFDWLLSNQAFDKAEKLITSICIEGEPNVKEKKYYVAKLFLQKYYAGREDMMVALKAIKEIGNNDKRNSLLSDIYLYRNFPKQAEGCAKLIQCPTLKAEAVRKILDYYILLDEFEAMCGRDVSSPFNGMIIHAFISHRISEGKVLQAIDEMTGTKYKNDTLAEELFRRAMDSLDTVRASKAVALASSANLAKTLEAEFKSNFIRRVG